MDAKTLNRRFSRRRPDSLFPFALPEPSLPFTELWFLICTSDPSAPLKQVWLLPISTLPNISVPNKSFLLEKLLETDVLRLNIRLGGVEQPKNSVSSVWRRAQVDLDLQKRPTLTTRDKRTRAINNPRRRRRRRSRGRRQSWTHFSAAGTAARAHGPKSPTRCS